MGSSHASREELEAKRKQFVDELNEVLKIFSEVITPAYRSKERSSGERSTVRQLQYSVGRLEVGARQFFVGQVVRSLSKKHFSSKEPPKRDRTASKDLEKTWLCKWCSERKLSLVRMVGAHTVPYRWTCGSM